MAREMRKVLLIVKFNIPSHLADHIPSPAKYCTQAITKCTVFSLKTKNTKTFSHIIAIWKEDKKIFQYHVMVD